MDCEKVIRLDRAGDAQRSTRAIPRGAWRVAFDGRYYRYPPDESARYHAAARGEVRLDWRDRTYRPAAWLLIRVATPD